MTADAGLREALTDALVRFRWQPTRVNSHDARVRRQIAQNKADELLKILAAHPAPTADTQEPIVRFLSAIREYVPTDEENFDTCVVCRDGECGGACPTAMYVVRQVLEALDGEDDLEWWAEEFGVPVTAPASPVTVTDEMVERGVRAVEVKFGIGQRTYFTSIVRAALSAALTEEAI